MSLHPPTVPARGNRNVHPEVEALEDRMVPAAVFISGATMTIFGDNLPDRVTIRDNGDDRVVAIVRNSSGAATAVGEGIERILVLTGGRNDRVDYTCTGVCKRRLSMTVKSGAGKDTVTPTFNRGVAAGVTATLSFQGGADVDNINASLNGTIGGTADVTLDGGPENDTLQLNLAAAVSAGATFKGTLLGTAGADGLTASLNGTISGTANVTLDGGSEDDTLELLLAAVSAGGTLNGVLNGGTANDNLLIRVTGQINGQVTTAGNGGEGNDTVRCEKFPAAGSNTFTPLQPPQSTMILNGEGGDDIIQITYDPTSNHNYLISVNGGPGTDTGQGKEPDSKSSVENDTFTFP